MNYSCSSSELSHCFPQISFITWTHWGRYRVDTHTHSHTHIHTRHNALNTSIGSAASHSASPATSSQGPVWIIWSIIAAHKWATPHEWKCSKASVAMITVCSQVIAPSPPPAPSLLPSPGLLLLLNEENKSSEGEAGGFCQKGEGRRRVYR